MRLSDIAIRNYDNVNTGDKCGVVRTVDGTPTAILRGEVTKKTKTRFTVTTDSGSQYVFNSNIDSVSGTVDEWGQGHSYRSAYVIVPAGDTFDAWCANEDNISASYRLRSKINKIAGNMDSRYNPPGKYSAESVAELAELVNELVSIEATITAYEES